MLWQPPGDVVAATLGDEQFFDDDFIWGDLRSLDFKDLRLLESCQPDAQVT